MHLKYAPSYGSVTVGLSVTFLIFFLRVFYLPSLYVHRVARKVLF